MRRLLLTLAFAPLAAGCSSNYIGNTTIRDTESNRSIWNRVSEYRKAVEERDADALLSMVSRSYFENSGTTDDPTDDYGYDELREMVQTDFRSKVMEVQLRLLMRRIDVDGNRATADYEYFYNFRYSEGAAAAWENKNDFNRLEFIREDGHWMIVGGL